MRTSCASRVRDASAESAGRGLPARQSGMKGQHLRLCLRGGPSRILQREHHIRLADPIDPPVRPDVLGAAGDPGTFEAPVCPGGQVVLAVDEPPQLADLENAIVDLEVDVRPAALLMHGSDRSRVADGYRLNLEGETKLTSESWCRVVGGSGQRHEITAAGSRLVDEGFV
jgi:hypothetical protein